MKKPKFSPRIRRIKLNSEQAVLACDCYTTGRKGTPGPRVTNYVAELVETPQTLCGNPKYYHRATPYRGGMARVASGNPSS